MKILFVSAGRRTYLVQYAVDLIDEGYDIEVWTSDVDRSAAALHISPLVRWFLTPKASAGESEFAEFLLNACIERRIDVVVPLMDYVIPALAKEKQRFAEAGVKLWVSAQEVVEACLDKRSSERFCAANGMLMPMSWEAPPTDPALYPVYKKKIRGSGSAGQRLLQSPSDDVAGNADGSFMYQSYVSGTEYGMDIFNDYDGDFVHACFRKKILLRSGETDKAETLMSVDFDSYARQISRAFRHVGNMDVDFIVDHEGNLVFLDFNPRFGGGYPFTHGAGVNYIRALIDLSAGRKAVLPNEYARVVGMKTIGLVYYDVE